VRRIDVELASTPDGGLRIRYFLDGDVSAIAMPPMAPPRQTDGLWQHTCFEAFIGGQGSRAYCEFNFSPSTEWRPTFLGLSRGHVPIEYTNPPTVAASITEDRIALEAVIPLEALLALPGDGTLLLGLAAVIETRTATCRTGRWHIAPKSPTPQPAGFVVEIERASTW